MTQDFGTFIRANKDDLFYLNLNDRRMRFNNAQDPIYFLFDHVENRPMGQIAKEFVQDTFYEISKFISKAVR